MGLARAIYIQLGRRLRREPYETLLLNSHAQQNVLHMKQKELPVAGRNNVRSGTRVPAGRIVNILTFPQRSCKNRQVSTGFGNPDVRVKLMGGDYFPLSSFLALVCGDAIYRFCFQSSDVQSIWKELDVEPACKCSLFH